jgi:hypothetical protein
MELTKITYIGPDNLDSQIFEKLSKEHQSLLKVMNGFILFGGGLHLRGACLSPDWHSLRSIWMGDHALHKLYPAIHEDDIPFAQDFLGNQFILRDGIAYKLLSEVGDLESLEMDMHMFLNIVHREPVEFLSLEPLIRFQNESGKLEEGHLVSVYPPFCTKESEQGVSLRATPMFERIHSLAELANR